MADDRLQTPRLLEEIKHRAQAHATSVESARRIDDKARCRTLLIEAVLASQASRIQAWLDSGAVGTIPKTDSYVVVEKKVDESIGKKGKGEEVDLLNDLGLERTYTDTLRIAAGQKSEEEEREAIMQARKQERAQILNLINHTQESQPQDAEVWVRQELATLPSSLIPGDRPQEVPVLAWHILEEWSKLNKVTLTKDYFDQNPSKIEHALFLAKSILEKYAESDNGDQSIIGNIEGSIRDLSQEIATLEQNIRSLKQKKASLKQTSSQFIPNLCGNHAAGAVFDVVIPHPITNLETQGSKINAEITKLKEEVKRSDQDGATLKKRLTDIQDDILSRRADLKLNVRPRTLAELLELHKAEATEIALENIQLSLIRSTLDQIDMESRINLVQHDLTTANNTDIFGLASIIEESVVTARSYIDSARQARESMDSSARDLNRNKSQVLSAISTLKENLASMSDNDVKSELDKIKSEKQGMIALFQAYQQARTTLDSQIKSMASISKKAAAAMISRLDSLEATYGLTKGIDPIMAEIDRKISDLERAIINTAKSKKRDDEKRLKEKRDQEARDKKAKEKEQEREKKEQEPKSREIQEAEAVDTKVAHSTPLKGAFATLAGHALTPIIDPILRDITFSSEFPENVSRSDAVEKVTSDGNDGVKKSGFKVPVEKFTQLVGLAAKPILEHTLKDVTYSSDLPSNEPIGIHIASDLADKLLKGQKNDLLQSRIALEEKIRGADATTALQALTELEEKNNLTEDEYVVLFQTSPLPDVRAHLLTHINDMDKLLECARFAEEMSAEIVAQALIAHRGVPLSSWITGKETPRDLRLASIRNNKIVINSDTAYGIINSEPENTEIAVALIENGRIYVEGHLYALIENNPNKLVAVAAIKRRLANNQDRWRIQALDKILELTKDRGDIKDEVQNIARETIDTTWQEVSVVDFDDTVLGEPWRDNMQKLLITFDHYRQLHQSDFDPAALERIKRRFEKHVQVSHYKNTCNDINSLSSVSETAREIYIELLSQRLADRFNSGQEINIDTQNDTICLSLAMHYRLNNAQHMPSIFDAAVDATKLIQLLETASRKATSENIASASVTLGLWIRALASNTVTTVVEATATHNNPDQKALNLINGDRPLQERDLELIVSSANTNESIRQALTSEKVLSLVKRISGLNICFNFLCNLNRNTGIKADPQALAEALLVKYPEGSANQILNLFTLNGLYDGRQLLPTTLEKIMLRTSDSFLISSISSFTDGSFTADQFTDTIIEKFLNKYSGSAATRILKYVKSNYINLRIATHIHTRLKASTDIQTRNIISAIEEKFPSLKPADGETAAAAPKAAAEQFDRKAPLSIDYIARYILHSEYSIAYLLEKINAEGPLATENDEPIKVLSEIVTMSNSQHRNGLMNALENNKIRFDQLNQDATNHFFRNLFPGFPTYTTSQAELARILKGTPSAQILGSIYAAADPDAVSSEYKKAVMQAIRAYLEEKHNHPPRTEPIPPAPPPAPAAPGAGGGQAPALDEATAAAAKPSAEASTKKTSSKETAMALINGDGTLDEILIDKIIRAASQDESIKALINQDIAANMLNRCVDENAARFLIYALSELKIVCCTEQPVTSVLDHWPRSEWITEALLSVICKSSEVDAKGLTTATLKRIVRMHGESANIVNQIFIGLNHGSFDESQFDVELITEVLKRQNETSLTDLLVAHMIHSEDMARKVLDAAAAVKAEKLNLSPVMERIEYFIYRVYPNLKPTDSPTPPVAAQAPVGEVAAPATEEAEEGKAKLTKKKRRGAKGANPL